MPIYAYQCSACGHAQDVLQKLSDPVLTECPACKASSFVKQVTAAGFQLKGSGWYVTDFRDGNKAAAGAKPDEKAGAKPAEGEGGADKGATKTADAASTIPATPATAPAPAPASASSGSVASAAPPPAAGT